MPLRTIARCLRGMAFRLRSGDGVDRLAEAGIEVRPARPVRARARRTDPRIRAPGRRAPAISCTRGVFERPQAVLVGGDRSALDAERRWRSARRRTTRVLTWVSGRTPVTRRRARPSDSRSGARRRSRSPASSRERWKKVAAGGAATKRVPGRLVAGPERPYAAIEAGSVHDRITGQRPAVSSRNRRSMRPQRNRAAGGRSRASVAAEIEIVPKPRASAAPALCRGWSGSISQGCI